ncbi:MAG: glycosyltransferase [Planctomycetota bacterium]
MKALQSVRHRWLGPTETWLYNQVRHLPASVEPHVVCQVVEHADRFPTAHVHAASATPSFGRVTDRLLTALRLRRWPGHVARVGRHVGADLLHAHFAPWAWTVRGAAQRLGVPLVVSFYGYDVNQLPSAHPHWRARYAELFDAAALVLCEGEFMARAIAQLGCPPERLRVQRLGVDVAGIRFQPRAPLPSGPLRVLMASAFREKKGIPIGLEALTRLSLRRPVELTLIGDASDLEASRVEKRLIDAALERARFPVRRLGFQPPSVLFSEAERHDLFLAPSHTASDGDTEGGAPIALIEMAATGIPVVSTTHCDIPGVVADGATGLLAREGDVDDLVATLERALQLGSRWLELTCAARAHVEARFDARAQGEGLAALYREVVERGRGRHA